MARTSDQSLIEDVQSVTITLENGEQEEFDLEKELVIPRDQTALQKEARKAPKRIAFWNYQTERALSEVRRLERKLNYQESLARWNARINLKNQDYNYVSDDMVSTGVTMSNKRIRNLRKKLDEARERYGIMRSIREAVVNRSEIIRAMVRP